MSSATGNMPATSAASSASKPVPMPGCARGVSRQGSAATILHLEVVNKSFIPGTLRQPHFLKHITLQVRRGEVPVVIGPSGTGKSPLLRSINFVAATDTGIVVFLGRRWSKDN